jgi:hypothetical protein
MRFFLSTLPLILLSSSNAFAAEPVFVAKALGLSKISESYLITEELTERLAKEYDFGIRILPESPCAAVECQRSNAADAQALWLITIEIYDDKTTALLSLYETSKEKNKRTKTVSGESWEEVRAKLSTTLLKMGKSTFSKIEIPEEIQEIAASVDNVVDVGPNEVGESEGEVAKEEPIKPSVPLNNAPPFSDFRARVTGGLGMYQYAQSSDEGFQHISPDVALMTILPEVQLDTEYWLPGNSYGVHIQAGIAPFGYKLGEDSSLQTITNLRAGILYHHSLNNMGSLEVGIAYHSTNGVGFQFTDERTSVGGTTQSIVGGALSVGIVTRAQGFDLRADVSETFAPMPSQTRIRLMAEKPLSVLPVANLMLTAHGGIQCTMRHFSFKLKEETGNVFDLQAGVFGGAGVSF